jgi:hypothetical protein
MRRRPSFALVAPVALAAALAAGCAAAPREIGFVVGAPTGIAYQQELANGRLVNVNAGLALGGGAQLNADWLFGETSLEPSLPEGWYFYWGVGLRVVVDEDPDEEEDFEAGIRIPLGLIYDFPDWVGIFFAELAPGIDAVDPKPTLDAAVGIRFPF